MTDKERLEKIIEYSKLSTNAFATSLGMQRSTTIYNILNGRNGMSKPIASLIATKYNMINYEWVISGKGEMLKNKQSDNELSEPAPEYKSLSNQEIISRLVVQNDKLIAILERHSITIENLSFKVKEEGYSG